MGSADYGVHVGVSFILCPSRSSPARSLARTRATRSYILRPVRPPQSAVLALAGIAPFSVSRAQSCLLSFAQADATAASEFHLDTLDFSRGSNLWAAEYYDDCCHCCISAPTMEEEMEVNISLMNRVYFAARDGLAITLYTMLSDLEPELGSKLVSQVNPRVISL